MLHAQDYPQDIYLLIGQSNAAGRAAIEDLDRAVVPTALLFTGSAWEPLSNPVNRYSTVIAGDPPSRLGPGYTFARKIAAVTGRKIGVVSNARGGTHLLWWQKGYTGEHDYDLYEEAVARAQKALTLTPNARLAGIIWHQGEADDSPEGARNYMQRLCQLTSDLRRDLSAPKAALIIGEVGIWGNQGTWVNPVMQTVGNHIQNAFWVSSAGLIPVPRPDGHPNTEDPHFNSLSQRVLGQRYADKALETIYGISPGVATLYASNELHNGLNFSGYSAILPPGEYDTQTLAQQGIPAGKIASVRLQTDHEVVFHNSQGEFVVRNDQPTLTAFDTTTISKVTVRSEEQVHGLQDS